MYDMNECVEMRHYSHFTLTKQRNYMIVNTVLSPSYWEYKVLSVVIVKKIFNK